MEVQKRRDSRLVLGACCPGAWWPVPVPGASLPIELNLAAYHISHLVGVHKNWKHRATTACALGLPGPQTLAKACLPAYLVGRQCKAKGGASDNRHNACCPSKEPQQVQHTLQWSTGDKSASSFKISYHSSCGNTVGARETYQCS
jgi:hypothetical protein